MEELIPLFGTWYIQIIGVLIAFDILLGIVAAIFRKEFALRKLGMFMKGPVLAYIFGFVIVELLVKSLGAAIEWAAWILIVVFVLIVLALAGSILRNLGKLGLPLPGFLKRD